MSVSKHITRTLEQLKQNGFQTIYFEKACQAKSFLLEEIALSETVAFGGSNTLQDMELFDALERRGNRVYWHRFPAQGENRRSVMEKAMDTDVYLSGVNAITRDGRIINVDGTGNRLAGMLFGHRRLYLVAGINKIVRSYEEAMLQIKNVSAPENTRRFGYQTPCSVTGTCTNCGSPQRICNATLILERRPRGTAVTVVLIGEKMGF